MASNGLSDLGVETLFRRVITAHKPLKFGEFADHFGDEIGLAQAGGLFGEGGEMLPILPELVSGRGIALRSGGVEGKRGAHLNQTREPAAPPPFAAQMVPLPQQAGGGFD